MIVYQNQYIIDKMINVANRNIGIIFIGYPVVGYK